MDVLEDEKWLRVFVELPGVKKDDIKLHATERALVIPVGYKRAKILQKT